MRTDQPHSSLHPHVPGTSRTLLRRAGLAGLAAAAVLGSVTAISSPAAASGPGDSFSAPLDINGGQGGITVSNTSATAEPGEPSHANAPDSAPDLPDHSVWFRWESPINGRVIFRTRGSDFDTVMAAYTGTSLTGLTKRADNDDTEFALPGGGVAPLQSQIGFKAVKGRTYRIAVDSFTGSVAPADVRTGTLRLTWDANDNFVNARRLPNGSPLPRTVVGQNTGATNEFGEPSHSPTGANSSAGSIWYSYQAPQRGIVTFETDGSEINTMLAVYRGSKVDELTQLAVSDEPAGSDHVSLLLRAGQTVKIAVDGRQDGVDDGDVELLYGYIS